MTIRKLSVQLANQIAAGEVVERPASVVKELLENAVDSGATEILCEVRGAGRNLIRVRDNGSGIVGDELPLALAPHATSKIATVEDLSAIETLGFRGEALASIAAVSKLTLTSKIREAQNAYSVAVEGPEQKPVVAPAAHPDGTSVEVRELFFNTPARRRFLRSDRTEMARIREVFVRTALSHPNLGFELKSEDKTVLKVQASDATAGSEQRRLGKILGDEFARDGLAVRGEDPALQVQGLILPPPAPHETLGEQIYLFLNGRPIADKLITHAVREAQYEACGRQASVRCILYLSCDPSTVDVNVHPRKDEVRFHESRLMHDLTAAAVLNALTRGGISADFDLPPADPEPGPSDRYAAPAGYAGTAGNAGTGPGASGGGESALKQNEDLPLFPENAGAFVSPAAVPQNAGGASLDKPRDSGNDSQNHSHGERPVDRSRDNGGSARPKAPSLAGFSGSDLNRGGALLNEKVRLAASIDRMSLDGLLDSVPGADAPAQSEPAPHPEPAPAPSAAPPTEESAQPETKPAAAAAPAETEKPARVKILDRINADALLLKLEGRYFVLSLNGAARLRDSAAFLNDFRGMKVERMTLSVPFCVRVRPELLKALKPASEAAARCGFEYELGRGTVALKAVPLSLKDRDLAQTASACLSLIASAPDRILNGDCPRQLSMLLTPPVNAYFAGEELSSLLESLPDADELADCVGAAQEIRLGPIMGALYG